ncbi:MAG: competence/damage-inducible protein A [Clostridia bacterium]|nr:competence/damage-inducible protein A [Clostridia bacterium]
MISAEIISVGTELLLGDIVNTDAAFISKKLAEVGIPLYHQTVVGDNAERLESAIRDALSRADILIMTGGLGPTCDDITKNIVSRVFSAPLTMNDDAARTIKAYFDDMGRVMTENNLSQAMLPEGAVMLENHHGTAPGVRLNKTLADFDGEKCVIMLPGPPRELEPMWNESVMPYLREISPYVLYSLNLHLYGIGESAAEAVLRDIMNSSENPTVAPYACEAEVRVRITARADTLEECRNVCRMMSDRIRMTDIGKYIFAESTSDDEASEVMVRRMIDLCRKNSLTVATAESCTAGMIAARIGDIPGCSDVLEGGVVSYSNEVKMNVLGVSEDVLQKYGAVSEECAAMMAEGARRVTGAGIAVSVTGIAGPGGGTDEKPVGTVCFGVADEHGCVTSTEHFGSMKDRGKIRRLTTSAAFMKLIRRISEKYRT